jgi:hypothetical protein
MGQVGEEWCWRRVRPCVRKCFLGEVLGRGRKRRRGCFDAVAKVMGGCEDAILAVFVYIRLFFFSLV